MDYHSVTPCRRYGKCHGEPFLRRRGTDEPVDVSSPILTKAAVLTSSIDS